jgi:predicted esterase
MRNLLIGIAVAAALAVVTGAVAQTHPGRLTARPGSGGGNCAAGVSTLRLGGGRTALMRVTPGRAGSGRALLLALHGAGGSAEGGLWAFREGFREPGLVLVAPKSDSRTWNPFYGPDLDSMNRALKLAFARCRVDPKRVAIGGFSDGATTALTIGLLNGDLFRAVMALSPGGVQAAQPVGKPRVFIAHGTRDTVLPIRISNTVVRQLRSFGYSVTYRKFAGGHEVPQAISRAAIRWFLRP